MLARLPSRVDVTPARLGSVTDSLTFRCPQGRAHGILEHTPRKHPHLRSLSFLPDWYPARAWSADGLLPFPASREPVVSPSVARKSSSCASLFHIASWSRNVSSSGQSSLLGGSLLGIRFFDVDPPHIHWKHPHHRPPCPRDLTRLFGNMSKSYPKNPYSMKSPTLHRI